ncbi:uncharacterized protein K452DRAFT_93125 [Aplosporella prunicola CBS 121167]|uniref:Kelch repeat protein n=1 Tax=Aplosporella prunicola CBS 121167 TaxID=1176127 RepID=A0A6A6B2X5_9PEZI|nr:uncharacterized protein K452DRAFT_93125 [Aplosporella prunicola CBS 121167]KAF2138400.1 hypothetical protein K452DRAFT_93125 [Aplosporella prunicola CBS 121167]
MLAFRRVGLSLASILWLHASWYAIVLFPAYFRSMVSARSLCGIVDQRTTIVGDRLLFSSGNYTFDDGETWQNTSSLYWLTLNDTITVDKPIDMSLLEAVDLPSNTLAGGKSPVSGGASGTFFYDHTTVYAYAGMVGPEADGVNNSLYSFNTTSNTWNLVQVEGGKISFGNNSEGVYATDIKTGTSFYTGGWAMAYNGTYNGTVKFQSANSGTAQPTWSFMTTQTGLQGPNILKGAMTFLRKGQAGILVAFGGYNTAFEGSDFGPGWDWDQRDMSDIWIYDIFSNTWYYQKATGDIPHKRTEFCAGVSSAPDDSSFQITIYGGWDQLKQQTFSDVYVLSLPSFRWIQVTKDTATDPETTPGRNRHKCNMWNDGQMIVSGGIVAVGVGDPKKLNNVCNQNYPPFEVLDTSTYAWRTQFDPKLEYSVPDVVTAVIGGSSSGGAALSSPQLGWNSSDLSAVFSKSVARDTYDYESASSSAVPTSTASSTSTAKHSHKHLSGGAIAGITVAVVAFVALVLVSAATVFCWLKRKKSRRNDRTDDQPIWHKAELETTERTYPEMPPDNAILEAEVNGIRNPEPVELPAVSRMLELPATSRRVELPP